MMRLLIVALCIVSTYAGAQNPLRMLVTANANYYLPRNSGKQIYPVLAYDSDADPKLLVGGFGLGFMIEQDVRNHFFWRAQINTSRRAYWDEVMLFNDVTGLPIGGAVCKGVDVVTNVTGAIHYKIGKSLSIGTGVGFDGLVYSYSRLPEKFIDNEVVRNSYYRSFVPLIPVELSVPIKRVLINLRYQHALINRLKSSIAEYEKDTYSALFIEVGYRIR